MPCTVMMSSGFEGFRSRDRPTAGEGARRHTE